MRVLHVVPYYPPDRIGGVGAVVAHLHEGLLGAGHESEVVTAGLPKSLPGVRCIARGPLGWTLRVALEARNARNLDVVHCHQGEAVGLALAMRAVRVKTPLLATYHVNFAGFARALRPYRIEGTVFGRSLKNLFYRAVTAPAHQLTDAVMLHLSNRVSFISKSGAVDVLGPERAQNATVIYNAVPPLPPRPSQDETPVDLLFVGSDSLRKRLHILPYVLRGVRERHPDATLRIIGPTPDGVPDVHALFKSFQLGHAVEWIGHIPPDDLPAHHRSAALLLVPSAYEGLPMVIVEAFRSGLPCVATDVSGHPEVVEDGVAGRLVPPDEPAAMADACCHLLADRQTLRLMSERAQAVVREKFSLDRQVREYLRLYAAVSSHAGSP